MKVSPCLSLSAVQSLESEEAKVFKGVFLDMADVEFAMTTSPAVMEKYEARAGSVALFQKVRTRTRRASLAPFSSTNASWLFV